MLFDQMCFVGKGEHLTVATTVAIGSKMILRTVRIKGKDTVHLLLAVAVGSEEAPRQAAFDNLYLRSMTCSLLSPIF